jgi:nitric oxide reductase NorD protein
VRHRDAGHAAKAELAALAGDLGRYSLVASAVAVRRLVVCPTRAGVALAYTDGANVFIPSEHPASAVFDVVVLHASLIASGSCEPNIIRHLKGRPRSTRRYFALEAARAQRELAGVIPRPMMPVDETTTVSDSAQESLDLALGNRPITELPSELGELRPKALLGGPPADAPTSAPTLMKALEPKSMEEEADDEEDAERSLFLEWLSSPLGGNGRLVKLFASLTGASKRSSSSGGAAGDESPSKSVFGRRSSGRGMQLSTLTPRMESRDDPRPDAGGCYPEWDFHRKRYRENWCTVRELEPPGRVARTIHADILRNALGRTRLDLRRSRHESQGEELDIDAVIMTRADARAGHTSDARMFNSTRPLGRDLGVLILIDTSGSTGEKPSGGESTCDLQILAAARLARSLETRRDRVAIYGFNSRGRSNVYVYPTKLFEKPLDLGWQSQLGKLAPGGFTRLGAAIRHCTSILNARSGAARQVLVVLSDGFPFDDGYEGKYAIGDTRRALTDARTSGIGCLCLSLGAQSRGAELESVFGSAAFACQWTSETARGRTLELPVGGQ